MSFPRYPEYKDSGVEWLGEVPAHWVVDRLKRSIVSCRNGIWGEEAQGDDYDIPCVRVADFDRRSLTASLTEPTIRNVTERERVGRLLSKGNLLLEKSGGGENQPVGCVVFYDDERPAVCSNFVARVEIADGMSSSFWRYVHAAAYAVRLTTGSINQTSGIQNLDQDRYFNERTAFPTAAEQSAIATFLDHETAKIDALVAEQEELIALLKEKRQAVISHAVTKGLNPDAPMKDSGIEWLGEVPVHWEVSRLKHATIAIVDCPHETPEYSDDGDYFVIRTADLDEGQIEESKMYRVCESEYLNRIRREIVRRGDIVYGREGERWGHAAVVPVDDRFCLGQRMMQFRVNDGFCSEFLMWQLNAESTYRQGQVDTVGATSPHVNVGTIRNYYLTQPPLEEQQSIGRFIKATTTAFDELIQQGNHAILLLKERRSALISAAVTGKIDVREFA
jgi:type I restriction enzyme, S subunit